MINNKDYDDDDDDYNDGDANDEQKNRSSCHSNGSNNKLIVIIVTKKPIRVEIPRSTVTLHRKKTVIYSLSSRVYRFSTLLNLYTLSLIGMRMTTQHNTGVSIRGG